jgi:hypothetical protein
MTPQIIQQRATCHCGISSVAVHGKPIVRMLCHCTICKQDYQRAFSDFVVFRPGAVILPPDQEIQFRKYRKPPALSRGTCSRCNNPVVGFLRLAPFVQLAFVPARNFPQQGELPVPAAHIFYHQRIEDVLDNLPKIEGYWASELAITKAVTASLLRRPG